MFNRLTNYLILTLLIILTVTLATVYLGSKLDQERMDQIERQAKMETRLIQWVYDNSTLISRATCEEIVKAAMKTDDPELMLAIAKLESRNFIPGSVSSKGAMGWWQINYAAHGNELIEVGIIKEKRDLWDTEANCKAGAFILKQKFKLPWVQDDVAKALHGYLGAVDGKYVLEVLTAYAKLQRVVRK